jgi:hypothetical protein
MFLQARGSMMDGVSKAIMLYPCVVAGNECSILAPIPSARDADILATAIPL